MQAANAHKQQLIVHVIYRFATGGMENGIVNLVNRLPRDRYRHVIVCLTTSGEFEARIENPDVEIIELHKRPGKDLSVYWRFFLLLRRLRPAIVHTRNLGTIDFSVVARAAGVPVRLHGEHGWDNADPEGINPKYLRLRRFCDRFIHGYICVSEDLAQWLEKRVGVSGRKIESICNGVDEERFSPDGAKAALPADWQGCTVVGSVGRLDPIKRFDWLIECFAEVHRHAPDVRLVIVGDGDQRPVLERTIDHHGLGNVVRLAGRQANVADWIRAMDVFALVSRNEGISNTILEALSTSRPVIATDVGGNCELVSSDKTGAVIASGDTNELVTAIRRYVEDPVLRRRHGEAARASVLDKFSLAGMTERYDQRYRSALGENGRQ